jgi:glucose-specific phosphotransferase system IIA component
MKLFKKNNTLLAICDGRCAKLSEMPDEAFASGMLGEGVTVFPASGHFFSPVSGKIESIAESRHAYTILSEDGLEILVHIGVDTVEMKGDGFTAHVKAGQTIRKGAPLADADLSKISDRGFSTATALLITNPEKIQITDQRHGEVKGAKDTLLSYRLVQKG